MMFEVFNPHSGHSFGTYEADTEVHAIEACVRDAGYESIEDMERRLGQECDLRADVIKQQ
jgi:hypothetical protein